jgi:hypothetical protein
VKVYSAVFVLCLMQVGTYLYSLDKPCHVFFLCVVTLHCKSSPTQISHSTGSFIDTEQKIPKSNCRVGIGNVLCRHCCSLCVLECMSRTRIRFKTPALQKQKPPENWWKFKHTFLEYHQHTQIPCVCARSHTQQLLITYIRSQ